MIVREACVGLKELGVFTLPKAAFHEGKNLENCPRLPNSEQEKLWLFCVLNNLTSVSSKPWDGEL